MDAHTTTTLEQRDGNRTVRTLEQHDVSDLIGLRVTVVGAVVERVGPDGEKCIEVPNIESAAAAAALIRCLMPVRLRGKEIRAIRKIAGMTAQDLAESMDPKSSHETLSRWENDKQIMGGYAEKVLRLVICEKLRKSAPGVDYSDGAMARLNLVDPWRVDASYEVPAIVLERVRVRSEGRDLVDAWGTELKLAA